MNVLVNEKPEAKDLKIVIGIAAAILGLIIVVNIAVCVICQRFRKRYVILRHISKIIFDVLFWHLFFNKNFGEKCLPR